MTASLARKPNRLARLAVQVMSFASAVSGPRASESAFRERLGSCDACPRRRDFRGESYCDACGCGAWIYSRLSCKLRLARLRCPLQPPRWIEEENNHVGIQR